MAFSHHPNWLLHGDGLLTIHQNKGKTITQAEGKKKGPIRKVLRSVHLLGSKQGLCCQIAHLLLLVACSPHPNPQGAGADDVFHQCDYDFLCKERAQTKRLLRGEKKKSVFLTLL